MEKIVQYELMRPAEIKAAQDDAPIAYVPFGSLEWHGQHLPLGNDSLKAHAVCIRAAQQSGGVVVPPVYFGFLGPWKPYTFKSLDEDAIDKLYTFIFDSLVHWGFRVLIGITGHNVEPQRDDIAKAIESVSVPGKVVGVAGWEVDFAGDPDNCATDHAGKWETSNVMYLYPDRVDMSLLTDADMLAEHRSDADSMIGGIGGLDPREHASAEVGEKNIELAASSMADRARELLAELD